MRVEPITPRTGALLTVVVQTAQHGGCVFQLKVRVLLTDKQSTARRGVGKLLSQGQKAWPVGEKGQQLIYLVAQFLVREQIGLAGKEQAVLPRFRAQGAQTAEHRQHIKNAAAQGYGCALHRGDAYIAEPGADECAVHHIVKGGHKSVVRRATEPANRRFDTPHRR